MTDHGRDVMPAFSWLPGLQAVRSYRRKWLAKDVIAGVVLTTLLVPQGNGLCGASRPAADHRPSPSFGTPAGAPSRTSS